MKVYILVEHFVDNQLGIDRDEHTDIVNVYIDLNELIKDAKKYVDAQFEVYKEDVNVTDFWIGVEGFQGNIWNYYNDYENGDYRSLQIIEKELI